MTKDELISKQQLLLEEMSQVKIRNKEIIKTLSYRFRGIGQPLNDNLLKMNKDQLRWVFEVEDLIREIE